MRTTGVHGRPQLRRRSCDQGCRAARQSVESLRIMSSRSTRSPRRTRRLRPASLRQTSTSAEVSFSGRRRWRAPSGIFSLLARHTSPLPGTRMSSGRSSRRSSRIVVAVGRSEGATERGRERSPTGTGARSTTPGLLLDIAPPREPIDQAWKERMLAGRYGQWSLGVAWWLGSFDRARAWSSLGRKSRGPMASTQREAHQAMELPTRGTGELPRAE